MRSPLEISIVPAAAADDTAFVTHVVDLVNVVYAEAERGLWQDGAQRTDADDIAAMIRSGQLAVARLDGRPAGVVRVQQAGDDLGEAGMLVADPGQRNAGV